jgi:hypothetical protein
MVTILNLPLPSREREIRVMVFTRGMQGDFFVKKAWI